MNDRDIGMSPDFGRPDDDGPQSYEDAAKDALDDFWAEFGSLARDLWGDDIECEPGSDNETIDIYRKHDHKLLAEQGAQPYGAAHEQEWEYD